MKNTFLIAEIGQAHDGSVGIAHSFIDALAGTGVHAVKFQMHIAEAESSEFEKFRVKFSYADKTRYDYWKRMEFSQAEWAELKHHCEEKEMEFIASPFSVKAVEWLEQLAVKRYKVGSGEVRNFLMLEKIARTGKPIIISSGMSDWQELDACIDFLKPYGNHLSLLQCTTAYPTLPGQWGLSLIGQMKQRYSLPVGYSDHSADIFAGLASVALGAEILEFHVIFSHQMFGPDAKASLTIDQVKDLVRGVKAIDCSLNANYGKDDSANFSELKTVFGNSLSVNKDVKKGDTIRIEDLESKKPANKGISTSEYRSVIGKKWNSDLPARSFITFNDITE